MRGAGSSSAPDVTTEGVTEVVGGTMSSFTDLGGAGTSVGKVDVWYCGDSWTTVLRDVTGRTSVGAVTDDEEGNEYLRRNRRLRRVRRPDPDILTTYWSLLLVSTTVPLLSHFFGWFPV